MSFHRSKVDLLWTDSGDLSLSDRLDLADTTALNYRAFIQQITTVVSASSNDWRLQPGIGANLNRFVGKPNNAELGQAIRRSIINGLSTVVRPQELMVEVFPIAKDEVAILLVINPYGDRGEIRLAFSYNSVDNKLLLRNV